MLIQVLQFILISLIFIQRIDATETDIKGNAPVSTLTRPCANRRQFFYRFMSLKRKPLKEFQKLTRPLVRFPDAWYPNDVMQLILVDYDPRTWTAPVSHGHQVEISIRLVSPLPEADKKPTNSNKTQENTWLDNDAENPWPRNVMGQRIVIGKSSRSSAMSVPISPVTNAPVTHLDRLYLSPSPFTAVWKFRPKTAEQFRSYLKGTKAPMCLNQGTYYVHQFRFVVPQLPDNLRARFEVRIGDRMNFEQNAESYWSVDMPVSRTIFDRPYPENKDPLQVYRRVKNGGIPSMLQLTWPNERERWLQLTKDVIFAGSERNTHLRGYWAPSDPYMRITFHQFHSISPFMEGSRDIKISLQKIVHNWVPGDNRPNEQDSSLGLDQQRVELVTIPDSFAVPCTDENNHHNLLFSHTFMNPELSVSDNPPMHWCPSPYCREVKTRRMTLYFIAVKHEQNRDYSFTGYRLNRIYGEVFSYSIWLKFNPNTLKKGWYQLHIENRVKVAGQNFPLRSVLSSAFFANYGDGSTLRAQGDRITTTPMHTVIVDHPMNSDVSIPHIPSRESSISDLFATSDSENEITEPEEILSDLRSQSTPIRTQKYERLRHTKSFDESLLNRVNRDILENIEITKQSSESDLEVFHNAIAVDDDLEQ